MSSTKCNLRRLTVSDIIMIGIKSKTKRKILRSFSIGKYISAKYNAVFCFKIGYYCFRVKSQTHVEKFI